jgi:hypothetical protein
MSPEATLTVDAKASCCVLRSLALIKYTYQRWPDLRTKLFAFLEANEHDSYDMTEFMVPVPDWSDGNSADTDAHH